LTPTISRGAPAIPGRLHQEGEETIQVEEAVATSSSGAAWSSSGSSSTGGGGKAGLELEPEPSSGDAWRRPGKASGFPPARTTSCRRVGVMSDMDGWISRSFRSGKHISVCLHRDGTLGAEIPIPCTDNFALTPHVIEMLRPQEHAAHTQKTPTAAQHNSARMTRIVFCIGYT
jgi:hypothetical protein